MHRSHQRPVSPQAAVEKRVTLTEPQRKLPKELDEPVKKGDHKHSPNDKGWFEKAKDVFR